MREFVHELLKYVNYKSLEVKNMSEKFTSEFLDIKFHIILLVTFSISRG